MAQMPFAEHHDMIEAFPADRAERGSRMPIDRTRRINISPYAPSRSRIRYRGIAARTVDDDCAAIGQLLGTFAPDECANYFRNSGYAYQAGYETSLPACRSCLR
jgi:hypothetical protein